MKPSSFQTLIGVACVAAGAAAQPATWTVGVGPAADFLDLPPAFAAAAPGDIILIESGGAYSDVTTSKGITLIQESFGQVASGSITVRNLGANQSFQMRGLLGAIDVHVENCLGPVRIVGRNDFFGTVPSELVVQNCADVFIGCSTILDLFIDNSRVMIATSQLEGFGLAVGPSAQGSPALRATYSDVTLARCVLRASDALAAIAPGPGIAGIEMVGGSLKILGATTVQGGTRVWGQPLGTSIGPAIQSSLGTVIVDSESQLAGSGGAPLVGNSQFSAATNPTMVSEEFLAPAFSQELTVHGTPGASACICLSLPVSPVATPFGELWLDFVSGSTLVVSCGVLDSFGEVSALADLSTVFATGDVAVWQGVTFDGSGLKLSNPQVFVPPVW